MDLSGKKVAIFVEDTYNDREFWYPYYRLQEEGCRVVVLGPQVGQSYTGSAGIIAKADKGIADVSTANFDGLIIPGGYAPDRMRRNMKMVKFVKGMAESGKVVAVICHAGWMLISAGVLNKRKATSFFAIKDDMINAGVDFVDQAVVVDGNIITSRTPADLPHFLPAIISALQEA